MPECEVHMELNFENLRTNESGRIIWMSDATGPVTNDWRVESWHTYSWIVSHLCMSHGAPHRNASLSHMWTRQITTSRGHAVYVCTLQHTIKFLTPCTVNTAEHCSTSVLTALQHTTTLSHYNTLITSSKGPYSLVYICALHHTATRCNTLQHNVIHLLGMVLFIDKVLKSTCTHCNTLQHTATHCNTLQHTATHLPEMALLVNRATEYTATNCNTRQNAATHCNTLQHTFQRWCCLWIGPYNKGWCRNRWIQ